MEEKNIFSETTEKLYKIQVQIINFKYCFLRIFQIHSKFKYTQLQILFFKNISNTLKIQVQFKEFKEFKYNTSLDREAKR